MAICMAICLINLLAEYADEMGENMDLLVLGGSPG